MTTSKELSVPPPVEDAELERLTDKVVHEAIELNDCECESMPCQHADSYVAAREALRSYVSRRISEAGRESVNRVLGEALNSGDGSYHP